MYFFTHSIEINADPEAVFAYHTDSANLLRITPRYLGMQILRSDPPGVNAEVEIRLRPFGLFAQHWHMRFSIYDPPRRLGDIMLSGPFSKWEHVREFIPLRNGNCLLNDSVQYTLPAGTLGRLANSLFVASLIRLMFASRQNKTKKVLEKKQD